MKKLLLFILFLPFMAFCQHSNSITKANKHYKKNTPDKDGTSYSKAIIIEKRTEVRGVEAEYEWLNLHYKGYKPQVHFLSMYEEVPYDEIKIKTSEGQDVLVYFDISNFYGKRGFWGR